MTNIEILFIFSGVGVIIWHGFHLKTLMTQWLFIRSLKRDNIKAVSVEILEISKALYSFSPSLESRIERINDSFLKEAFQIYLLGAVRGHEFLYGLRQKADSERWLHQEKLSDLKKLMINLSVVGWSFGLCLVAGVALEVHTSQNFARYNYLYPLVLGVVVYGLFLFHFIVLPMGSKLATHSNLSYHKNIFVIQALSILLKTDSTLELYNSMNLILPESAQLKITDLPRELEQTPAKVG